MHECPPNILLLYNFLHISNVVLEKLYNFILTILLLIKGMLFVKFNKNIGERY